MSRAPALVYDDAVDVPGDITGLVGVDRFGSLLHQRRRLWEHVMAAAREAGFTQRVHLKEPADRLVLADEVAQSRGAGRYVYLTSDVVCGDRETLARHLEKVAYAEEDLLVRPAGAPVSSGLGSFGADSLRRLLSCRTPSQRREWFRDRGGELDVLATDELACLSSADQLVRFLADTFSTRAFNRIDAARRTIRKHSADRAKMRREHDYWYLLPPSLQRFVVQPFGYTEDATGASYELERLGTTDFAVLWVHGPDAVSDEAFSDFLDAVFEWFTQRDRKPVGADEARAHAERLYRGKVTDRMAALLATETGQRLDRTIASGTSYAGLQAILDRYLALLDAEWKRSPPDAPLAVMHGDLCFSNVLFDKRSGLLRFIDPRGASEADEIWGDPYYDLAKLSHSALGGYDFVNHELFDVVLGDDLGLVLRSDRPASGVPDALFLDRVRQAGFDPVRMRLYEASLFLSMLPLHAEAPRKLAAFTLTAISILDEVAAAREGRKGGLVGWLTGAIGGKEPALPG